MSQRDILPLYDKIKDFHSRMSYRRLSYYILELLLIEDTFTNKDAKVDLVKLRGLLCSGKLDKELDLLIKYCGNTSECYLIGLGDSIPKSSLRNSFLLSALVDGKDINERKIISIFDSIMSKYEKE